MTADLSFFARDTVTVARDLLGCTLVSRLGGAETRGVIVETEAYLGRIDPAAHSYRGRTERVRALYEGKGLAYVYLIYGMYWCLNFSTGADEEPECVLIRALEPTQGLDIMSARRGTGRVANLCSGPGKLCAALAVDRGAYGLRLWDPASPLTLETSNVHYEADVSPRIGVDYAGDAKNWPLRFTVRGSQYISRRP